MNPDEIAIRTLHDEWIAAVNSGDLACLLGLMTDDVVFFNPGQAPFGRAAFASNFSSAHQQVWIDCASALEEVVTAGDLAYTRSSDMLSVKPRAGGAMSQLSGYRITVYRKQADGRWQLARDINTLAPLAADAC